MEPSSKAGEEKGAGIRGGEGKPGPDFYDKIYVYVSS